ETNFVAAIASACQRPVRPLSAVGITKQSGHDAWSRVFHTVPPRRPRSPSGKPDAMDVTKRSDYSSYAVRPSVGGASSTTTEVQGPAVICLARRPKRHDQCYVAAAGECSLIDSC